MKEVLSTVITNAEDLPLGVIANGLTEGLGEPVSLADLGVDVAAQATEIVGRVVKVAESVREIGAPTEEDFGSICEEFDKATPGGETHVDQTREMAEEGLEQIGKGLESILKGKEKKTKNNAN